MIVEHGLADKALAQIQEVLSRFPAVEKALLFGSRAKGNFKTGSDVDLALVGSLIDWSVLLSIRGAFDDSELPYRFSVVVLNELTDPDVAAHIRRVGFLIYERDAI